MLNKKNKFKIVILITIAFVITYLGLESSNLISRWRLSRLSIDSVGEWEAFNELEQKLDNHALSFGHEPEFSFINSLIVSRNDDTLMGLRLRTAMIEHLAKQNLSKTQIDDLMEIIDKSKHLCLAKEGIDELDEVRLKIKQKLQPSHGLPK